MVITITNAKYAPMWGSLQNVIREVTGHEKGRIIKIDNRQRHWTDYRSPGEYELVFEGPDGPLPITLYVEEPKDTQEVIDAGEADGDPNWESSRTGSDPLAGNRKVAIFNVCHAREVVREDVKDKFRGTDGSLYWVLSIGEHGVLVAAGDDPKSNRWQYLGQDGGMLVWRQA